MKRLCFLIIPIALGWNLKTVPAGAAPGAAGVRVTEQEATQLVAYHNQVRAEVGVAPVAWSPELARYAQEWADRMAASGKFEHRPSGQQLYGENLATGSSPSFGLLQGAQGWYEEKSLYRAGAPFTTSLLKAGHYTQMVWRDSTHIGAGRAVFQKGPYLGWQIIVCNYAPRGNKLGKPAY